MPSGLGALQALQHLDLAEQFADMQIVSPLAFLTSLTNLQFVRLHKCEEEVWSARSVFYLIMAQQSLRARRVEGNGQPWLIYETVTQRSP